MKLKFNLKKKEKKKLKKKKKMKMKKKMFKYVSLSIGIVIFSNATQFGHIHFGPYQFGAIQNIHRIEVIKIIKHGLQNERWYGFI